MVFDAIYNLLGRPVVKNERDPMEVTRLVREEASREEFERLDIIKTGIIYRRDPMFLFVIGVPAFLSLMAFLESARLMFQWSWLSLLWLSGGLLLLWLIWILFTGFFIRVPDTIFVQRQFIGEARHFSNCLVLWIPGIMDIVPFPTDMELSSNISLTSVVKQGPERFGTQIFDIKLQFRLNGDMPKTLIQTFRDDFFPFRLEVFGGNWQQRLYESQTEERSVVQDRINELFKAQADEILSRQAMEDVMFDREKVNQLLTEHMVVPFMKLGVEIIYAAIEDVRDAGPDGWKTQHERATLAERRSAAEQREAVASQEARTAAAEQNRLATLNELSAVEEIARKETETLAVRTEAARMLATLNQQDLIERLRAVEGRGAQAMVSKLLELTPQQYADVAAKTAESLGNTPETVVLLGTNDTVNMHPVMAFAQAMERVMNTMGIGKKP